MFLLPRSEDRMILTSFVCVQCQRVTDGRTDRRTELPWLIQRAAVQAMWPRCSKTLRNDNALLSFPQRGVIATMIEIMVSLPACFYILVEERRLYVACRSVLKMVNEM